MSAEQSSAGDGARLEGLWQHTINSAGQPPAPGIMLYTSDGGAVALRPNRNDSTGLGHWERIGERQFSLVHVRYRWDREGKLAGSVQTRATVELADTLDRYRATFTSDVLDPDGKRLESSSGTAEGHRFAASTPPRR
jgi:hypothetical protein